MDTDRKEAIEQFQAFTGVEPVEDATFYLESAEWDIQAAVDTYFASRNEVAAEEEAEPVEASSSAGRPNLTVQDDAKTSAKEERWFTGGGVGSGQEVIAPSSRKPVDDVFNAAREMGARNATAEDMEAGPSAFTGGARTLSGGVVKAKAPAKRHEIKFYANEIFTVNDGPPRNIHDKVNTDFMQAIMKGQCPLELEATATSEVSLMQIGEDYVEAAKPRPLFQGSGQRLGASTSSAPLAPDPSAGTSEPWEGPDEKKSITSIQLRLPDGTRMVAKFNHSQPVSDIRKFIASARPDFTTSYTLLTGFPAKPVPDESLSLEAAGLLNAMVILQ